jgi:hypothetical protein
VTYALYDGEGHGLGRPANRLDFYSRAEAFLAQNIGGRADPWLFQTADTDGATVRVYE